MFCKCKQTAGSKKRKQTADFKIVNKTADSQKSIQNFVFLRSSSQSMPRSNRVKLDFCKIILQWGTSAHALGYLRPSMYMAGGNHYQKTSKCRNKLEDFEL